jgi:hypothetical protein
LAVRVGKSMDHQSLLACVSWTQDRWRNLKTL